jgi:hypothetical protein
MARPSFPTLIAIIVIIVVIVVVIIIKPLTGNPGLRDGLAKAQHRPHAVGAPPFQVSSEQGDQSR